MAASAPAIERPHKLKWYQQCFALILIVVIRLLRMTMRFRFKDESGVLFNEPDQRVIYCFWHNRLAVCLHLGPYFKKNGRAATIAGLVSASRDGGILARVIRAFGLKAVRGSSSRRGQQAMRELTTAVREGNDVVVTPDGPRGPRYVAKEGVIALARVTGCVIVPIALNYSRKRVLGSWDKFQLPYPFSRCDVLFSEAIRVPRRANEEERKQLCAELQQRLTDISVD